MNPPFKDPEIIETTSEEEKQEYQQKAGVWVFGSALLFSFVLRHVLCCCLQLFARFLLLSLSRVHFSASLSHVVSLKRPFPSSSPLSSHSLFYIHHGFSPEIHPGQATIPYKAQWKPPSGLLFPYQICSNRQGLYRIKPGM